MTLDEAVRVLIVAGHRGVRGWRYDPAVMRVMPAAWDRLEAPPVFTAWEAVTIARGLVALGVVTE